MIKGPKNFSIGIIGYGKVGKGIVKLCLRAGLRAIVIIRNEEKISELQKEVREYQKKKFPERKNSLIAFTSDYKPLQSCTIIIESIREDESEKVRLYKKLRPIISKRTLVVTTTSSLHIGALAKKSGFQNQFAALHFFQPVQSIAFVEIIPSGVRKDLLERLLRFVQFIKYDYKVVPDIPGFIANRILFSEILASCEILGTTSAKKEDIDTVVKQSLAHPMGPFELVEFIGVDTADKIMRNIFPNDPRLKFWKQFIRIQKV